MEKSPIVSIASLEPVLRTRARIRVLVIGKTKRTFYEGGGGVYFNMGLCDDSGEIKAGAFNEDSIGLYETFEVNKMYYISDFDVVNAKETYNFMNNDLEIKMVNGETQVKVADGNQMPRIRYKLVEIEQIYSRKLFTYLDVIGVCVDVSEVEEKQRASDGLPVLYRDITLVDQTRKAIKVVLWEDDAELFSGNEGDILAIKGAEVYKHKDNKQLRCSIGVILNPDVSEADTLRALYENDTKPEELMVQD